MALTTQQEEILHRAVLMWITAQEAAQTPLWGAKLTTATAAQKRTALAPYVNAIKADIQATITALTTTRAQQDTDLQNSLTDANAVLSELGA